MKFLGLSLMIFATGSLMSMQESNKKQYFLLDGNTRNMLPGNRDKLPDRLSLEDEAAYRIYRACYDADKYGAGKALFIKDKQQFLAKIALIRVEGVIHQYPNYLVKIKPWDKVKLFEDNQ